MLYHPTHVDGRTLWVAPEVQEIINLLHFGYPPLGWEGDPRLALYRNGDRWELWRLCEDGEYRMITRSKPGVALDHRLIRFLVTHDTRRGYDPKKDVDTHNAGIERDRDREATARNEDFADKLRWALKKDTGE